MSTKMKFRGDFATKTILYIPKSIQFILWQSLLVLLCIHELNFKISYLHYQNFNQTTGNAMSV